MFGLPKHSPDVRYGAVIDIGSGSVGVAVVVSDPAEKSPEIIWSHREVMLLKDAESALDSSRHITTALINALLTLGSEGLKVLHEKEKGAHISLLQMAISAPWSYTITKTVSYAQEQPFTITKQLIQDLIATAEKQALEMIDEDDIVRTLGLELITKGTINISANSYSHAMPIGQKARDVTLSQVTAISQQKLLKSAADAIEKVLPDVAVERYSFMLLFYCVMQRLAPDTHEVCLIDVTYEATEIGIVRDGILQYVTHVPIGTLTIARSIAAACDIPHDEALAFIRGNTALEETLSDRKREALLEACSSYEKQVIELFKRTGDALSIPRPLFIHTDARTEEFFSTVVKKAASQATKTEHGVHLVTSKLLGQNKEIDTALVLSSQFFHKMHGCQDFEQL